MATPPTSTNMTSIQARKQRLTQSHTVELQAIIQMTQTLALTIRMLSMVPLILPATSL